MTYAATSDLTAKKTDLSVAMNDNSEMVVSKSDISIAQEMQPTTTGILDAIGNESFQE